MASVSLSILGEGVWETISSWRITHATVRYTHHTNNLQGLNFYPLLLSDKKSCDIIISLLHIDASLVV
jgi:hypothetical protein